MLWLTGQSTAVTPANASEVHASENVLGEAAALARTCSGCHAPNTSKTLIPPVDQLSRVDLYEILLAYKRDERAGTVMNRLSKGYTDRQLELIASALGK